MTVGKKVDKDDYNYIQGKVNSILGTGSGNTGYGQPVQSSPVTVRDSIGANDWALLRLDVINIHRHQLGTVPSTPTVAENDTIRFNSSTEPYSRLTNLINGLDSEAQRFRLGALQFGTTNHGGPPNFTSLWKNKLTCTVTVDFDNGTNARHFFNSGGKIEFTSTRSGGESSPSTTTIGPQNQSWTNLLNQTVSSPPTFGGRTPGTGVEPNNGQNWFRCRNSYDRWYKIDASSPYGANSFEINARTNVSDNSNGTAYRVQFLVEWEDDHVFDTVGPDGVDGTLTLSVTTIDPIFTISGTPSPNPIEVPSISFSNITGT